MTNQKIVITGIGGYVGSAIAHNLIAEGRRIVGFGHDENFSILEKNFGDMIELVAGDITDEKKIMGTLRGADAVIHTASPTTEKFCIERPWEAFQTIVYGTRAVLRAVQELQISPLIHFSTQAVYMNFKPRELPLQEDVEPKPDTVYGVLKLAAERELRDAPVVILRPANIYGKNPLGIERKNVITRFVAAIKKGDPLMIKRDGLQRADYIHLRDVVAGVKNLLANETPKNLPLIYNVGSNVSRSIREIADTVMDIAKKKGLKAPSVVYQQSNDRPAADRALSVKRLQTVLPDFPSVLFEEGVREMFD